MGTVGRKWAKKVFIEGVEDPFRNAKDASIYLGVSISMVYKALSGRTPTANGYKVWWGQR